MTTNPQGSRRNAALFAAAAFLMGVLGTVAVLKGFSSPNSSLPSEAITRQSPEEGHQEHDEKEHTDAGRVIRLSPEGEKTIGVRTVPVTYRGFHETLTVPGTVEASQSRVAKVAPPVAGKVVRILVSLGDAVQAGQALVVLDSYEVAQAHAAEHQAEASVRQAHASLQTARAEVEQARTRMRSAQKALQTQQELAKAGAFAQAPLQSAQSELSGAQSELLNAQTELQSHQNAYQRTERLFKEGIVSRAEMEQAQLELAQDRTAVERAKARVDIARQTLAREQRVAQGGLLNRQAVQAAEAEVRAAESEVARFRRQAEAANTALSGARDALEAARANLAALEGAGHVEGESSKITLYAPFSGVITQQEAALGESRERGSTLFVVEDLSVVDLQANVSEADINRVRVGQRVEATVASFPRERFTGRVQSLASSVDEKTRALRVRCLVSNPTRRLKPEMFAQVQIQVGLARRAMVIPESALISGEDGQGYAVFVADAEALGEYAHRPVEVGDSSGGMVEVKDGVKEGERVVVAGAFTLQSELTKGELSEKGHAH